ncbi:unnamed protein product [Sphagnum troendelagicum]|uniref:Uncharacterized protein n=1 Tax=Sphagnum troendelagicum TaxID=128251 RepID=A0ABP0UTQ6_9BRYO
MQKHGHKVHLILLRSQQDTTRSNRLLFCLPLVSFFLSFFPHKSHTFNSFPSNFTESSSYFGTSKFLNSRYKTPRTLYLLHLLTAC